MLLPGNLDLLLQILRGPVVPLVCGFIRRDNRDSGNFVKTLKIRVKLNLNCPRAHAITYTNHKNYNFLGFDWFKKGLFSTNSLAKLLSDSLLLDSLLSDSLLSDSSKSQSHSKM